MIINTRTYFLLFSLLFVICTSLLAEKKAVFIIGTGRCGSSCTAGLLQLLGLPLGNQLRSALPDNNPKGFFEDIPTVKLTKTMLQEIGARFVFPRLVIWDNHPKRDIFKQQIKECLQTHFNAFPFFGIKNPIIGLFLPLYCEAAQELGYTPKIVIIKRNFQETYLSWQNNFKNMSYKQITYAINCYTKAIDFYAPSYDSLTIEFNDIIHNTYATVAQFKKFLPELRSYEEAQTEIESFIDKNLKHHNK